MSVIDDYAVLCTPCSVMTLKPGDIVMLKKGRFNSSFIDEDGLYTVHSVARCNIDTAESCRCCNDGILIRFVSEDSTYGRRCACDCEYYKEDGSRFAEDFRYYKE